MGQGIPLLCLHTAGADSRQFRHLMCDAAVTQEVGHFPMSENPAQFRRYVLPVLDEIRQVQA